MNYFDLVKIIAKLLVFLRTQGLNRFNMVSVWPLTYLQFSPNWLPRPVSDDHDRQATCSEQRLTAGDDDSRDRFPLQPLEIHDNERRFSPWRMLILVTIDDDTSSTGSLQWWMIRDRRLTWWLLQWMVTGIHESLHKCQVAHWIRIPLEHGRTYLF